MQQRIDNGIFDSTSRDCLRWRICQRQSETTPTSSLTLRTPVVSIEFSYKWLQCSDIIMHWDDFIAQNLKRVRSWELRLWTQPQLWTMLVTKILNQVWRGSFLSCPLPHLLLSHRVWGWMVSLSLGAMRERNWSSAMSAWRSTRSVCVMKCSSSV